MSVGRTSPGRRNGGQVTDRTGPISRHYLSTTAETTPSERDGTGGMWANASGEDEDQNKTRGAGEDRQVPFSFSLVKTVC